MDSAAAKRLVRRWYEEIWNQGRLDVADEIFASTYIHPGQTIAGPGGSQRVVEKYRRAFPDIEFRVEDLIAEGDRVVARLTFRGTHLGPFDDFLPTARRFEVEAIGIFQIRDGRLSEHWGVFDFYGLVRQLGFRLTSR